MMVENQASIISAVITPYLGRVLQYQIWIILASSRYSIICEINSGFLLISLNISNFQSTVRFRLRMPVISCQYLSMSSWLVVHLSADAYLQQYKDIMDFIELRSDTRTVPTKQMREAILTSSYGDWTYNEDQTVKDLQAYTAKLFGKEDAAYVISGVFGNQVCILTATNPGDEVILREKAHVIKYENGSCGMISRAMTRPLDCPEGYITPAHLKKVIRKNKDSQSPKTAVVVLEFPTFQGLVPPIQQFQECCKIAKAEGIHVHVDGARTFHGLAALNADPAEIFKNVDSLTFCLSKGLCAPLGSLVVGDKKFIARLKANRKMLGGVIRKPGIVAGPALVAMKTMPQQLAKDNEMAILLSEQMVKLGWMEMAVPVQTNMIFFRFTDKRIKAAALEAFFSSKSIQCEFADNAINRFVVHHYIREEQVQKILSALSEFRASLPEEDN